MDGQLQQMKATQTQFVEATNMVIYKSLETHQISHTLKSYGPCIMHGHKLHFSPV